MGVSPSNIFVRCDRLGLALAEHAGISIQSKRRKARGTSRSTTTPKISRVPRQPVMKKTGARNATYASTAQSREMSAAA